MWVASCTAALGTWVQVPRGVGCGPRGSVRLAPETMTADGGSAVVRPVVPVHLHQICNKPARGDLRENCLLSKFIL